MDPETPYPVIDLLPEQKEVEDLGGTMRLGAQAVELAEGSRAARGVRRRGDDRRAAPASLRGQQRLPAAAGRRPASSVSGTFQEGRLVEIVELPDHPWFVASQFHPEFKSRPDPAGAALPRVRRGGARPGPHGAPHGRSRVVPAPDVLDLFTELAVVPSPPGDERAVADLVLRYLAACGLDADEDGSAEPRSGRTPAISMRASSRPRRASRSCSARTSTRCRRQRQIEPVVDDGSCGTRRARSSAPTTRRPSRRCSRRRARVLAESRPHAGIELLFTPKEEVGLHRRGRLRPRAAARADRLRLRPGGADRRR